MNYDTFHVYNITMCKMEAGRQLVELRTYAIYREWISCGCACACVHVYTYIHMYTIISAFYHLVCVCVFCVCT